MSMLPRAPPDMKIPFAVPRLVTKYFCTVTLPYIGIIHDKKKPKDGWKTWTRISPEPTPPKTEKKMKNQ